MPIESLTEKQCTALAERILKTLASLWLDQNGVDADVCIRRRETNED